MKISMKMLYSYFLICILFVCSFFIGIEPMLIFVLMVWSFMMFYTYNNMKDRSMLFAFLIAFFVFLLGRDFVQQFFKYQVENFDENTQFHAYLSYIIALITIGAFHKIFSRKRFKTRRNKNEYSRNNIRMDLVRQLSLYTYYVSWVFAIVSKIAVSSFVAVRGISDYYTDYSEYLSGNTVLYFISKIELIMPVAWCIYLATRPEKKRIRVPMAFYVLYLVISLGGGQRSTALLGLLFLFVYFMYRHGLNPEEGWITKRKIFIGVISLPLLTIFVSAYNILREGGNVTDVGFLSGIMDFFYDQGVTSNIVKRAYMHKEQIPDQIYTLEFMHSGVLARIFNITVYHGNNVEHALYGGSFTHSLGYVVMGSAYLAGRGTGSSYIAELYQDLGYFGIFAGNILYALLIAKIANRQKDESVFGTSVRFMIITQLLWAPRGSFTGFISQSLAPTTLATFAFIFGLSRLLYASKSGAITKTVKADKML